jgi:hypothetical protein
MSDNRIDAMQRLRLGAGVFLPSTDGSRSVEIIPMRPSFWASGRVGLHEIPVVRCVFPALIRLRASADVDPIEAEVGIDVSMWEHFAASLRDLAAGKRDDAAIRIEASPRVYSVRMGRGPDGVAATVGFEGETVDFVCSPGGLLAAATALWENSP